MTDWENGYDEGVAQRGAEVTALLEQVAELQDLVSEWQEHAKRNKEEAAALRKLYKDHNLEQAKADKDALLAELKTAKSNASFNAEEALQSNKEAQYWYGECWKAREALTAVPFVTEEKLRG